jgi:hypothetical protein
LKSTIGTKIEHQLGSRGGTVTSAIRVDRRLRHALRGDDLVADLGGAGSASCCIQ